MPKPGVPIGRVSALVVVLMATAGCEDRITDTRQSGSTIPPEVTAWLQGHAHPLNTASPGASYDDLSFLPAMIGDARIVALGENTHGTRDFFEMKDRILRYLAQEMDFDAFAIEATWPEANRIDTFVRGGAGDPGLLLAGLYFWTWKTQAVRQMILWMRDFNAAGGDLGFQGFDMKYPGMAIHNIESYVASADPGALPDFETRLACLKEVANDAYGVFPGAYRNLSSELRDACRTGLEWVRGELASRQAPPLAVQSANVILQFEAVESGLLTRDEAMAENVAWLLEQLGPDGRVVLWAHNFHVGYQDGAMGAALRRRFGSDYVTIGFTHTSGTFTAVSPDGLATLSLDPVRESSYEAGFHSTGYPRFLIDLRPFTTPSDSTQWLWGPRWTRFIGCCYDPNGPQYWTSRTLPSDYDMVIHLDRTQATTLLETEPPGVW